MTEESDLCVAELGGTYVCLGGACSLEKVMYQSVSNNSLRNDSMEAIEFRCVPHSYVVRFAFG